MSDRPAGSRIADELDALALDGASGTMRIDGDPSGTICLNGGDLTFAESSSVPDLATRLAGSQRLPDAEWRVLLKRGQSRGEIGPLLVERGVITRDDLRAVLRSAVLDAVIALTAPMTAGRFVATTRFAPRESHPAGSMLRLSIESVWAEVARRARQLARHDIPLEARPQLSDLRHHGTIVKREQWAVACKINGVATVRELAWRNGFALHDTIEWVGELVEAGLCTLLTSEATTMTDRGVAELASDPRAGRAAVARRRAAHGPQLMVGPPPGGHTASASSPEAVVAGPESGPGPPLPLPRRRPVTRAGIGPGTGARSFSLPQELKEISETPLTPVSADLLQWVLRGLKRMSLLCRSRGIDDKGNHYCR